MPSGQEDVSSRPSAYPYDDAPAPQDSWRQLGHPVDELSFSENYRLLFCDGVMLDDFASLGAVPRWNQELGFNLHSELQIDTQRSSAPVANRNWKRALARVLIQDSHDDFLSLDGKVAILL
jgi:hypothetical protein